MILLIDEDAPFRTALAAVLRNDGHVVQEHAHPRHLPPLDTLSEVSLAIMDHAVPRRNGLNLLDAFHQAHPHAHILILAGYWSLKLAGDAAARPFVRLLRKPISYEELRSAVRDLGVTRDSSR